MDTDGCGHEREVADEGSYGDECEAADEDGYGDEEDVVLEDLLPDSLDEPPDAFRNKPEEWLEVDGQQYHKGSLIAQHLKANRSKKVVERTLHVRGLTLDNLRKHHSVEVDVSASHVTISCDCGNFYIVYSSS